MALLKEVWGDDTSFTQTVRHHNEDNIRTNLMNTNYYYGKYNDDKLTYYDKQDMDKLPVEVRKIKNQMAEKKYKKRKPKVKVYDRYMSVEEDENSAEHFASPDYSDGVMNCASFIKHLRTCKKCQRIMKEKYSNGGTNEQIIDIAIYGLTGVFILFLLDMFINLGKRLA